jgi:pimeloyl-ACP methyl ester carboxylesterase
MRISARGVSIEVDDRGPPQAQPLLMIMGLGMQLTSWPDELVALLLARGFRVIRYDNRDAGLSQGFDETGTPHLAWAGLRYFFHLPVRAPYTLADMADDALGVMDALGLPQAHVCGASLGGMIAQHLAARRPERVRSLALMMTTPGARHLPQPGARIRAALMSRPDGRDPDAVVAHLQRVLQLIGSPGYRPDPEWQARRLREMVARAWRPAGTARQVLAVIADGDRTPLLASIKAPTVVIHGCDDPLVPVAAGEALQRQIAGAQADFVPGMGHDLPLPLLERFADRIARNAARQSAP